MRTFVIGNSHTVALKQGLRRLRLDSELHIFPLGSGVHERSAFSEVRGPGVVFLNEDFWTNFRQHAELDAIDQRHRWGICMGTHNARVYRDRFWAESEPETLARPGKRPVSRDLLDSIILADQRYIREFIANIRKVGAECFVVSCPPPREDFATGNAAGIRPEVIKHVDDRARELFRGWLAEQGIDIVEPPEGVTTGEGFLHPDYCAPDKADGRKDPHHGNAAYGALMIQRILSYLQQKGAEGAGLPLERQGA